MSYLLFMVIFILKYGYTKKTLYKVIIPNCSVDFKSIVIYFHIMAILYSGIWLICTRNLTYRYKYAIIEKQQFLFQPFLWKFRHFLRNSENGNKSTLRRNLS